MRACLLLLLMASLAVAGPKARMEEARLRRGQGIARFDWFDETGVQHSLGQLAGYPLILLPMYSHCRGTCPANVQNLERALSEAKLDAKGFRVLLFSIDPDETSASLAAIRKSEAIPLAWLTGRADAAAIDALTNSIGFQFGRNGDQFMHPNVAIFVDRQLAISDWIYGSDFSAAQIERGLAAANGENFWLGRHAVGLYGIAIFLFSAFLILLTHFLFERRRALRRDPLKAPPQVTDLRSGLAR